MSHEDRFSWTFFLFIFVTLGIWTFSNCNARRDSTFRVRNDLKDKTIVGDAALTLYDVKHPLTCALRCSEKFPCAFFFHSKADGVCMLYRSLFTSFNLTHAPGYKFFANAEIPDVTTDSETGLCANGTGIPHGCWKQVPGRMSHVSIGPGGVWGCQEDSGVYYMLGTYGEPSAAGLVWFRVPSGKSQVDVGHDAVYAVDGGLMMSRCRGITSSDPYGSIWENLSGNRSWSSVSPENSVWIVDSRGKLFHARHSANHVTDRTKWDMIAANMRRVDAGWAGVWALDAAGRLCYRTDTYGGNGNSTGTGWVMLEGEFSYVSSGTSFVVAVTSAGSIWFRVGLSADAPTGLGWALYPGIMKQVEIYEDGKVAGLWAVDFKNDTYFSVVEKQTYQ